MQAINIYVIEHDKEFLENLKKSVYRDQSYNLVGFADDYDQFLKDLENIDRIDMIFINLFFSNYDSVQLIKMIKTKYRHKIRIVVGLTAFCSDMMLIQLNNVRIDYIIMKPLVFETALRKLKEDYVFGDRLGSVSSPEEYFYTGEGDVLLPVSANIKMSLEYDVGLLFKEIGFPPHLKGYNYLRDAVVSTFISDQITGKVGKEFYSEIADRYNTTVSRVERDIRHLIETVWTRGNIAFLEELFGYSPRNTKKPKNSEFMIILSGKLKRIRDARNKVSKK